MNGSWAFGNLSGASLPPGAGLHPLTLGSRGAVTPGGGGAHLGARLSSQWLIHRRRGTPLPWGRDAGAGSGREREAPGDVRALLAASLPRPPNSCLIWKRAAALLLMRARWRLFKATGGVAAPPEPGSCPRPRAASPAPGRGVPGATRPHHPHLSAPHPLWRHFNQGEGRSCPCPSPPPCSSNRGDFCPNLGRKRDARPSAFGDPLWTRPQGENTSLDLGGLSGKASGCHGLQDQPTRLLLLVNIASIEGFLQPPALELSRTKPFPRLPTRTNWPLDHFLEAFDRDLGGQLRSA
ncbi:uncharacterized protein [Gorilla gorilla gorilla]|uniref:uncharacterized protein n=1 Tax=Gorilla gorilla gorilla TaxID=9595 RepID=UPI00244654C4|nr:uncharacterized protein LOC101145497 isoform X1 [Gorilla gorilla gorilla]